MTPGLEHDLGWDQRTAEVVVGSSAGSITATLLRLGVPASDLAAWAVEAPLSVDGEVLATLGDEPPVFDPSPCATWPGPGTCPRPLSWPGRSAGRGRSGPRSHR